MIVAGFHERGEGFVEHRQGKFAKEFGFDGWCASWEIGIQVVSTGLLMARAPLLYSGSAAAPPALEELCDGYRVHSMSLRLCPALQ